METIDNTIYQEHGFNNRGEYLQDLSEKHEVDILTVEAVADMLGPNEDFDGLVNTLKDIEAGYM